jgi:hypothetical protein
MQRSECMELRVVQGKGYFSYKVPKGPAQRAALLAERVLTGVAGHRLSPLRCQFALVSLLQFCEFNGIL